MFPKLFLDSPRRRICWGSARGGGGTEGCGKRRHGGLRSQCSCSCLDLTNRQVARNDLIGEFQLTTIILDGEEGSRVPSGDVTTLNHLPDSWLECKDTQQICDRCAVFPYCVGHLLLG